MTSTASSSAAESSSWSPIDLRDAVSGDYSGPQPALLRRSDGKHLIYPGKLHSFAGVPGGGKSWLVQVLSAQVLTAGSIVLYFDFEDAPESVVSRLKILGVPDQLILDRFGYVSPSEPLPPGGADGLDAWVEAADLVVFDGVTDAMTLHGWNPLDNQQTAQFMQRLVGPLGSGALRPAVVMVDHVTKSSDDRGRYAIGAQHKLAAVQVQFTVATLTPFNQDSDGTIALSVTKDRYGQVQRLTKEGNSSAVAAFHFRHPIPGQEAMAVYIDPPEGRHAEGSSLDSAMLSEILRVVGHSEAGVIKSQIKDLVTGRDATILRGIKHLRALGLIEGVPFGNTTAWRLVRPLEGITSIDDGEDAPTPDPSWVSASELARLLSTSDVLPPSLSMPWSADRRSSVPPAFTGGGNGGTSMPT